MQFRHHQASIKPPCSREIRGTGKGGVARDSDPGLIWVGVLSSSDGAAIKDKLLPVFIFQLVTDLHLRAVEMHHRT